MSTAAPDSNVPAIRIRPLNDHPVDGAGKFVLYWMIANRRVRWNFSLQRALDWSEHLGKPLVIFEPLRVDYRWASDRFHTFVAEGMRCNQAALACQPAVYYPYLEPAKGADQGLLAALTAQSALVITDDFPCFFLPALLRTARPNVAVRIEAIDGNGLLPMRATEQVFSRAYDFRRFLQKNLLEHLLELPQADPFDGRNISRSPVDLSAIQRRWPAAAVGPADSIAATIQALPIEHAVDRLACEGGMSAADLQLAQFLESRLPRYADERNRPETAVTSELSGYLHFGHLAAHQIFAAVAEREAWNPTRVIAKPTGSSSGWWSMTPPAESFLDELITWRELGFNFCAHRRDYNRYESLPDWAQATLRKHAGDPRLVCYGQPEFESAQTHDPLWNAAQRQLVREGRIHNYLRMLWGKKILEWSQSPQAALDVMIELNNKYAIDGRNPNSYSGIFWVLGRYDRPWGPERPIFGTIRYMSSDNTARKFPVKEYIRKYSSEPRLFHG